MPAQVAAGEVEPFARDAPDVLAALGSDRRHGLTDAQVAARRATAGVNALARGAPAPAWRELLRQFNDLVVWILIVAAIISGLLGDRTDVMVILAIVLLNGMLGFLQERRAERAFAELERMAAPAAMVIRNGTAVTIPARDLVPGDLIELRDGNVVPADARLLDGYGLRAQESSLTGESVPVDKVPGRVLSPDTSLGDRCNMVYLGTAITGGRAHAVVTAIGMRTEVGRIAGMIEAAGSGPTPLQRRLNRLGKTLVAACLALIAVTFAIELARGGEPLEVFLLAVSLAVAAIPEGLPAVVTVTLAIGVRKMARRNALVRRLPSVETLGSVTVICSDKTGTLTSNEMMVCDVEAGGTSYRVTGSGYRPEGEFLETTGGESQRVLSADVPDLALALQIGARCNHARLVPPAGASDGAWHVVGDPTEGALLVAARKAGLDREAPGDQVIDEVPFDSRRRQMAITVRAADGTTTTYRKGAAEALLAGCDRERWAGDVRPLSAERRSAILARAADRSAGGLRVLGLAYQPMPASTGEGPGDGTAIFAGLVGMIDPPRAEALAAIVRCRQAGIRPVMITGDHPATALAVARELGIATDQHAVLTGRDVDRLTDDELGERSASVAIYARVTAEHKLRIVRALKARGEVVAVTGDGTNDAPAIRAADIGIAMGLRGTDVTRESADLVLLDDDFATIVAAVEQGRGILDNIQKFLHYLLSGNAAELAVVFIAAVAGWPLPLVAAQLLWINLVTDGLPAIALGFEPVEPVVMHRPPRPLDESLLGGRRGAAILSHASLIAAAAITAFVLTWRGEPAHLANARAVLFATLAFAEMLFALNCRSDGQPLLRRGIASNPWLLAAIGMSAVMQVGVMLLPGVRDWFDVNATLAATDWLRIVLFSVAPFVVIEAARLGRVALGAIDPDGEPPRQPLARALFVALAVASLVLGVIGLVAPIIPGMFFLALGALLLARGSARWRRWLQARSWFVRLRKYWRPLDP